MAAMAGRSAAQPPNVSRRSSETRQSDGDLLGESKELNSQAASELAGLDHEAQPAGPPAQAAVERHEPAIKVQRQGQVLGVVGLGPPQLLGQPPRHLTELAVGTCSDR